MTATWSQVEQRRRARETIRKNVRLLLLLAKYRPIDPFDPPPPPREPRARQRSEFSGMGGTGVPPVLNTCHERSEPSIERSEPRRNSDHAHNAAHAASTERSEPSRSDAGLGRLPQTLLSDEELADCAQRRALHRARREYRLNSQIDNYIDARAAMLTPCTPPAASSAPCEVRPASHASDPSVYPPQRPTSPSPSHRYADSPSHSPRAPASLIASAGACGPPLPAPA